MDKEFIVNMCVHCGDVYPPKGLNKTFKRKIKKVLAEVANISLKEAGDLIDGKVKDLIYIDELAAAVIVAREIDVSVEGREKIANLSDDVRSPQHKCQNCGCYHRGKYSTTFCSKECEISAREFLGV